jgi:GTP cyclohydrolase I
MSSTQVPKTRVVEIAEAASGATLVTGRTSEASRASESARGPQLDPIADVQNKPDTRHIAIDKVGIKDIRHPVLVKDRSQGVQHTIANFNMYVELPHNFKGTHMSRFVEILNAHDMEISVESFKDMLGEMSKRLEAEVGHIEMSFPYFINKAAPVSGVKSLMDYQVSFIGEINGGRDRMTIKVVVPVTSLCPCSKEISKYGAHNQRSHVTISVRTNTFVWVEDLIDLVEKQASCELYGLLKRPDEKHVTERAYENPKFVEDMVRDVAAQLNADARIDAYVVESENFESIHNHSAYAMIRRDKAEG